jgi:uncharacterized protein with GYD domain
MAKYLVRASYTATGAQGLIKEGGSKRRKVVDTAVKKMGGKLESFYYALGDSDVYAVAEFPDTVSAVALSVAIAASGAVRTTLTPLITAEDMDKACQMHPSYAPPGA